VADASPPPIRLQIGDLSVRDTGIIADSGECQAREMLKRAFDAPRARAVVRAADVQTEAAPELCGVLGNLFFGLAERILPERPTNQR
jgi:hypothetical protein